MARSQDVSRHPKVLGFMDFMGTAFTKTSRSRGLWSWHAQHPGGNAPLATRSSWAQNDVTKVDLDNETLPKLCQYAWTHAGCSTSDRSTGKKLRTAPQFWHDSDLISSINYENPHPPMLLEIGTMLLPLGCLNPNAIRNETWSWFMKHMYSILHIYI